MTGAVAARNILIERACDGGMSLAGSSMFIGTASELLEAISSILGQRMRAEYIMTLNVDQVLQLRTNQELFSAFESAVLRTVDGVPLTWVGSAIGTNHVYRNTGADLLYLACQEGAQRNWKIVIAGGPSGQANQAASNLASLYPGLRVIGLDFPIIETPEDPSSLDLVSEINRAQPDLVFLCLGCPKQELWFSAWRSKLEPAVYVGAGAAVGFASGSLSRAPSFIQRYGFEWLWRLAQDPRRLAHRYLIKGPGFLSVFVKSFRASIRGES